MRRIPLAVLVAILVCAPSRATARARSSEPAPIDWGARIETAKSVEVLHEIRIFEPAPFHSRKPCDYVATGRLAKRRLSGAWIRRIAGALGPDSIEAQEKCGDARCEPDSTGASRLVLEFRPRSVRAVVDFEMLRVSWSTGKRFECSSLRTGVDSLLALLREALPEDAELAALRPCAMRHERPDAPPVNGGVGLDRLPEAIDKVPPRYPDAARSQGTSGTVMVEALIGKDGSVQRTRLEPNDRSLDEAAVRAVEQWRFRPAKSRGKEVAVWVMVPVKFSLH